MLNVLCFVVTLAAVPQNPPPPPPPRPMRDAGPPRTGTAVIKGHVYMPDGRPLRRAQISLRGAALPDGKTAGTGLEGEYELADLPPGRYTLTAVRSGYLPIQYGQRRHGEPGKPLEIVDGGTIEKVNFTMERAGVISGRVSDETGEPVARATVWAMQTQFFQGRRRLVPINTGHVSTDDSGLYRLPSLPPGEYVVLATFRETWMSDGREKQMLSYAPSYFPGTSGVAEATRVKIAAGEEAAAIDVTLVPGRAATLSGTVTALSGAPLGGAGVMLEQQVMGPGGGTFSIGGQTRAGPDGTWRLRDVPPGEYLLQASGTLADGPTESARMPLFVTGADVEGLALGADAGGIIAGTVVTDSGAPLPSAALRVFTQSPTFERSSLRPTPGQDDGAVGADGRFSWKAPAGPALVRVSPLPSGWAIKQVRIGEIDTVDTPVDVRPGQQISGFTVVLSNRLPAVSGRMLDENGQPADGTVLLFPTASTRWYEAAGSLRTARPDQSGKYRFDNVRPGEYLAIALDYVRQWQANDPEFLEPLRERAIKLTVGDEPVTTDLKVVK